MSTLFIILFFSQATVNDLKKLGKALSRIPASESQRGLSLHPGYSGQPGVSYSYESLSTASVATPEVRLDLNSFECGVERLPELPPLVETVGDVAK